MEDDTEYISDLNPIIELASTDSFIVETLDGTKRIEFKDFILGPDNVSFYEEVAANTLAVIAISSDIVNVNEDLTTINSGLTALSSAYDESVKSGFCYVEFTIDGTLNILCSSTNVSNIIATDGGSRLQIIAANDLNLDEASINVTLDDTVSANDYSEDFISYTPIIDGRTTSSFKVGVTSVKNTFTTISLPTGITVASSSISPVTSISKTNAPVNFVTDIATTLQSVMLNPSGTGDVTKTVGFNTSTQNFLTNVEPTNTPTTVVTNATVTNTSFTIMSSELLGTGAALKDIRINISFRYV